MSIQTLNSILSVKTGLKFLGQEAFSFDEPEAMIDASTSSRITLSSQTSQQTSQSSSQESSQSSEPSSENAEQGLSEETEEVENVFSDEDFDYQAREQNETSTKN